MDKLKMHTKSKVDVNIESIGALFPNTVTETIKGYDENDNPIVEKAIDFDILKQELSKVIVEGREERYQMNWPGKKEAILAANTPVNKTLRPCRADSVKFDETENLYIEGDNLEVLKLLQETYLNRVKMIYIDPPYNTGNDSFVYNDNFAMSNEEFSEVSGQYDEDGNMNYDIRRNNERSGKFHTDWLNMMYPRLKLAKDLLTDEGVIFISIDDHEVENLKKICNEIFGEHNFISILIWQNKKGGGNDSNYIAIEHEYILIYAKNKKLLSDFYEQYDEKYLQRYKEEDSEGKYYWDTFKRKSGKQYYPIKCPDGTVLKYDEDGNEISWLRSEKRFKQDVKDGEIRFYKTVNGWSVQFKQRLPKGKTPRSLFNTEEIIRDQGTTSSGGDDIYKYFKKDVFSNPKPVKLMEFILGFGLQSNDIVLDFFSGSGTIAEAVMRCNIKDGGNRKYILVQIAEDLDEAIKRAPAKQRLIINNSISVLEELKRPHLLTELAKERIKRAIKDITENNCSYLANLDLGFRVLKIGSSNMKDVYYNPNEYTQDMLSYLESNIKDDRSSEDLLFQVMLDLGELLSSDIKEINIEGKKVFNVGDGNIVACFDEEITNEVLTEIAKMQPLYAVFRDSSLSNDSVATNFEQIFKTYSPNTIRKVL